MQRKGKRQVIVLVSSKVLVTCSQQPIEKQSYIAMHLLNALLPSDNVEEVQVYKVISI